MSRRRTQRIMDQTTHSHPGFRLVPHLQTRQEVLAGACAKRTLVLMCLPAAGIGYNWGRENRSKDLADRPRGLERVSRLSHRR
jgi:hypothetical protein